MGAGQAAVDVDPLGPRTETGQGIALGSEGLDRWSIWRTRRRRRSWRTSGRVGRLCRRTWTTRAAGIA
jgi:hypothetical protein